MRDDLRLSNSAYLLKGTQKKTASYLKDLDGGDAIACYGFKYSSDYSGASLVVRRSSDNAVKEIGWKFYQLSGDDWFYGINDDEVFSFCGSSSGFIRTFYDSTGNNNHAYETTTTWQPRIVNSGVVARINGIPAPEWVNGQKNRLQTADFTTPLEQPNTIFSVAHFNGASGKQEYLFDGVGQDTRHALFHYDKIDSFSLHAGVSYYAEYDLTAGNKLFYTLFKGINSEYAKNGSDVLVGDTGNQSLAKLRIGYANDSVLSYINYNWNSTIGTIILYPVNKSSQRGLIENYLNKAYKVF
ncbi:MAG: hypothetical protein ACLFQP_12050 [Halothece sp.]